MEQIKNKTILYVIDNVEYSIENGKGHSVFMDKEYKIEDRLSLRNIDTGYSYCVPLVQLPVTQHLV